MSKILNTFQMSTSHGNTQSKEVRRKVFRIDNPVKREGKYTLGEDVH
jgi:hypothetical protein